MGPRSKQVISDYLRGTRIWALFIFGPRSTALALTLLTTGFLNELNGSWVINCHYYMFLQEPFVRPMHGPTLALTTYLYVPHFASCPASPNSTHNNMSMTAQSISKVLDVSVRVALALAVTTADAVLGNAWHALFPYEKQQPAWIAVNSLIGTCCCKGQASTASVSHQATKTQNRTGLESP